MSQLENHKQIQDKYIAKNSTEIITIGFYLAVLFVHFPNN